MLKGVDPLLSPDLLHVLAAMGHGDELAIVDGNFPATSTARRLVRLDGHDLPGVTRAVLTVFPLDSFVETPVSGMGMVGDPSAVPDVQREVLEIATAAEGRPLTLGRVERHDFYERARRAFAVVATGESRAYGCVLLTKGVLL